MADASKEQGQLMDWTLLDDTGGTPTLESGVLNSGEGLDSSLDTVVHITMCHADANDAGTASAGWRVLGRVSGTDEGWRQLSEGQADAGQANAGDCDAESAAAQANVYVTSTTNFENPGDVYFLMDVGTLADSCLVINKDFANDDYFTHIDNLVNTYDSSDFVYDIVNQWQVRIPVGYEEVKVVFYNTDGDATYACRVDYAQLTDVE